METKLNLISSIARWHKGEKINNLIHLINETNLHECFYLLKKDKEIGVDGVTLEQYQQDLEENISRLITKMKSMSYRSQPVKRSYILKPDGRKRPLGIPTIEDKMVQVGFTRILESIYETEFLDFSYAYRPGRNCQQAIKALNDQIYNNRVNYIIDADIKGFFDNVDHQWLRKFIEHRISDKTFIRYIVRFLKSGIVEKGKRIRTNSGTPQGGVISPILANIYLHYVLDLWMDRKIIKESRGYVSIVRYADDFVICVEHLSEAETIMTKLKERLAKFSLELSAEKTKIVKFGRGSQRSTRKDDGDKNLPTTFDFLGFTHFMSRTKYGSFKVGRKTSALKFSIGLQGMKDLIKKLKNLVPIGTIWKKVSQKLLGHYSYFGISDNWQSITKYFHQVKQLLFKWLNRRSQKRSFNWERFSQMLVNYPLPKPKIYYRLY